MWLKVFRGLPSKDEKGNLFTCDHIDGNSLNDNPINFRWASITDQNNNKNNINISCRYIDLHTEKINEFKQFKDTNIYGNKNGEISRMYKNKLKLMTNKKPEAHGYIRITADEKHYSVHRIIAYLYGILPENKLEFDSSKHKHSKKDDIIDHVDGNPANNNINNLRLVTHTQNIINAIGIPINCYTWDKINKKKLEFVKKFETISEASKELEIPIVGIQKVISGKFFQTHNYTFKKVNSEQITKMFIKVKKPTGISIKCYKWDKINKKKTDFIKKFASIMEASKELHIDNSYISKVIANKASHTKEYTFEKA